MPGLSVVIIEHDMFVIAGVTDGTRTSPRRTQSVHSSGCT